MPPLLYELPIVLLMNVEWIAIQCYVPYVMHFVIVSCLMFHIAIKWFELELELDSPAARISCTLIGQNSFAPGAHPLFSYVTPFDINISQFDQAGSVRLDTGWEAPELSKSDDTLTNWGLTLEVRGTTGCTRVLGDGIGATEHEWGCWCFGATEHLYPYRMKHGLGGSVAQNTTAISLI